MTWHILRKDLRRLAMPAVLVNCLLVAASVLDAWRYDFEVGLAETVLNLILPLAWGVLIALAVQLEPLTSDTAFWLTRPYRRPALLTAKVLFALITIHIPVLLSHGAILVSHGFSPFELELLWKQGVILFAVTLPSLAIASITSSVAGFGWCALTAGAVALLLDAALQGRRFPWIQADWMPGALALCVIAAGGLGIVLLQYARRTRLVARAAGVAIAVAGVLVFAFIPRDLTGALQCAVAPDPPRALSVRFEPGLTIEPPVMMAYPGRLPISVPVRVTGAENASRVVIEQLSLRISLANGASWLTRREPGIDRRAFLVVDPDREASAQTFVPDSTFLRAAGSAPVKIEGRASIRPFRETELRTFPPEFAQSDVPGLGRCSASIGVVFLTREMLKVVCESPRELHLLAGVKLVDSQTGREWKQRLGDSANSHLIPALNWLSPLNRRQTFLQIVEKESDLPSGRWLVHRPALSRSRIHIQPAVEEGCTNVDYSFEVQDIGHWIVPVRR